MALDNIFNYASTTAWTFVRKESSLDWIDRPMFFAGTWTNKRWREISRLDESQRSYGSWAHHYFWNWILRLISQFESHENNNCQCNWAIMLEIEAWSINDTGQKKKNYESGNWIWIAHMKRQTLADLVSAIVYAIRFDSITIVNCCTARGKVLFFDSPSFRV